MTPETLEPEVSIVDRIMYNSERSRLSPLHIASPTDLLNNLNAPFSEPPILAARIAALEKENAELLQLLEETFEKEEAGQTQSAYSSVI